MNYSPLALVPLALLSCSESATSVVVPPSERFRTQPALVSFVDCDELLTRLQDNLRDEMDTAIRFGSFGAPEVDVVFEADGSFGADSNAGAANPEEGTDFTGTNNQEAGVDEADFVKTDGSHFWLLDDDRLEIFGVPVFGALEHLSSTNIEGRPNALLQVGTQVVVFSEVPRNALPPDHPLFQSSVQDGNIDLAFTAAEFLPAVTKLTAVDVSDPTAPEVEREIWLDGQFLAARRVDTSVRLVAWSRFQPMGLQYFPELVDGFFDASSVVRDQLQEDAEQAAAAENDAVIDALELTDFLPQIVVADAGGFLLLDTTTDCSNFAIADDGTGRDITSILSLDLTSPTLDVDADYLVGNASFVYSSTDTLVVAEPANDAWWYVDNDDFREATNLHRFDISQPGSTVYTGSGRVEGRVASSFSLSEHEGFLRVASSTGGFGNALETHVFVLAGDGALEIVGQLDGIAPGETLWAARFVEDRGFLVTFRVIDPLFTIDLSEPTNPRLAGELEIPGVSVYIHPIEGDRLLTIGRGGNDFGLDGSMQVSLFDVSDFTAPALVDDLPLGFDGGGGLWNDGWSSAGDDHKAFQFFEPLNMLAVPVSGWSLDPFGYDYRSHLQLVEVEPAGNLRFHGQVDHSEFFNAEPSDFQGSPDIRRSFFLGDFIYAFSGQGATADRVSDLQRTASVALD